MNKKLYILLFFSVFRPSQGDVRNEIQRRLINTMMQAEGALKVYTQLLNNLPISSIAKSQLIAQYHVANIGAFAITSAFSIFKQMVDTVIGENGNTSTIGMFLDAMDNAGWGLGRGKLQYRFGI